MASLIHVNPLFPPLWAAIAPYLERALEIGGGKRDWNLSDVYDMATKNSVELWALTDEDGIFGGCATTVNHYPRRRSAEILLMGADDGAEDKWRECLDQLIGIARQAGIATITGTGRPGWARKLGCKERRVFEIEVPA
jgi:hypothetical protein